MKKLLVVSAVAALGLNSVVLAGGLPEEMPMAPAAVSASETGIYGGISGGFSLANWKIFEKAWNETGSVSKDNGFAGRVFLGYDMTRYFALEFGYTYFFFKPEWKYNNTLVDANIPKFRTMAFDLMLKGKLPVVENFDLFAKVGGNYLMTKNDKEILDGNAHNFNVAFGAGGDYYITPNIIASVEWLRFNGKAKYDWNGNKFKAQPYTDSFLFGLRYKIDI